MPLLVLVLSCHDYFKGFEVWNKVCKIIVVQVLHVEIIIMFKLYLKQWLVEYILQERICMCISIN